MKPSLKQVAPLGLVGLSSFGLGQVASDLESPALAPACVQNQYQEMVVVELQELLGDQLRLNINGPGRLVWNEAYVEGDGEHLVALGQLPSEADRDFRNFAYVGNAGTMKYYPSNTYAARGTAPEKRRFFATRQAAEAAGFVASKLVK